MTFRALCCNCREKYLFAIYPFSLMLFLFKIFFDEGSGVALFVEKICFKPNVCNDIMAKPSTVSNNTSLEWQKLAGLYGHTAGGRWEILFISCALRWSSSTSTSRDSGEPRRICSATRSLTSSTPRTLSTYVQRHGGRPKKGFNSF